MIIKLSIYFLQILFDDGKRFPRTGQAFCTIENGVTRIPLHVVPNDVLSVVFRDKQHNIKGIATVAADASGS